ncbi:MAG: hypothetical protein KH275_04200 [Clostridiales bacterium]|nr:hypothetical protein [Clostridiales bacterium]
MRAKRSWYNSHQGGTAVKNIRKNLFSEKGMTAVNALFLLSLLLRDSGVIFIAYLVWIAYLALGIKNTSSKGIRIINSVLIAFAMLMVLVNLYLLLRRV